MSRWQKATAVWPFVVGVVLAAWFLAWTITESKRPLTYSGWCGTPEQGLGISDLLLPLTALALPLGIWGLCRGLPRRRAERRSRIRRVTLWLGAATLLLLLTPLLMAVSTDRHREMMPKGEVAVKMHAIQVAVQSWAVEHGDLYPEPWRVTEDGLADYCDQWPEYWGGHRKLRQGTGAGDFQYSVNGGRTEFRLVGYDSQGHVAVETSSHGWDKSESAADSMPER
jgi:hypothetical protein